MILKIEQNEVTGWWTSIQDGDLASLVTAADFAGLLKAIHNDQVWQKLERTKSGHYPRDWRFFPLYD